MNSEALSTLQAAMTDALMSYPVGALAYATAWLVPTLQAGDYTEGEEDDCVIMTLCRLRDHMPDSYARSIAYLRSGCSEEQLSDFMVREINDYFGDDVANDIEQIAWSLWFPCLGLNIFSIDFWLNEGMDRVHTIIGHLGAFGDPEERTGPEEAAIQQAVDTAGYIFKDIEEQNGKEFEYLRCLLWWICSNSGNTILDYDDAEFSESGIEYPQWHEFEWASEVWFEAVDLHHKAVKGMELLEGSTEWLTAFLNNVHTIWSRMKKGKRDKNGRFTGLRFKSFSWPQPTPSEEAVDGAVVL